jgi:hypothetical protein
MSRERTGGEAIVRMGAVILALFGAWLFPPLTAPGQESGGAVSVGLPSGVRAAWNLEKAYRETTPTRERICINGLWRWQPAMVWPPSVYGREVTPRLCRHPRGNGGATREAKGRSGIIEV